MKIGLHVSSSLVALACLLALTAPGIGGGKKLTTTVEVLDDNGRPAAGRQVILEFDGPKGVIFTDPALTTAKGVAKVKHGLESNAKVYVDGDHASHATTGQAPGKITVRLGGFARYLAIDRHALKAPPAAERTVESLAKYLAAPAKNDLDKVRAIYKWITDRIAFDISFRDKREDNTAEGTLKNRRCVCHGYASLFEALAEKMDLKVVFVRGLAKGFGQLTLEHAWNAVQIDGDWKLFDTTFGAGLTVENKFEKRFVEFYFQADPAALLLTHFPDDPKWQFRDPPLAKAEFDAFPRVPWQIAQSLSAERIRKMVAVDDVKEFCTFYNNPGKAVVLRNAPLAKTLKAGVKYRFQLEAADYSQMEIENGGKFLPLPKNGPLFDGYIVPRQGPLVLIGSKASGGATKRGLVGYEVK
jgi:hypothetical protein